MTERDKINHIVAELDGIGKSWLGEELIKLYDGLLEQLHKESEQSPERVSVNAIVSGSLPDDEAIEDKALDYIEDEIYISTGEGHDTCREWAFVAGAKWMREQIGNDH